MSTTEVRTFEPLPVPFAMSRPDRVAVQRYYDAEFFAMERDLLWPRVWQMAARLAEIPTAGDFVEYEILDKSILVVRQPDGGVKAFHNACRHRGVQLVKDRGNISNGIICPFHSWSYSPDGQNTFVYQPDAFAESNRCPQDLNLVECRADTWGGCAFINLDPQAPPLRNCLEPFATWGDAWEFETLHPEWWLQCRVPANWKTTMEAFMEGYHAMQTHPQLFPGGFAKSFREEGDGRQQADRLFKLMNGGRDVFDRQLYVDRQIGFLKTLGEGMGGMAHTTDIRVAEGLVAIVEELPDDFAGASKAWTTALNAAVTKWHHDRGAPCPDLNANAANGILGATTFCFPHFFMGPMLSSSASYRIRPIGPEECLFDLWSLTRYPKGEEPPAPPRPEPIAPDDPRWPPIPAQDFSNIPRQQKGLHAGGFEYMRLSDRMEGMIGNYQRLIDGFLAGLSHELLVPAMQRVSGSIECETRDIGF
jgi:phenylpropionate dioxygenase-like ring-hydroxylating dioxygenase large terminal subunit